MGLVGKATKEDLKASKAESKAVKDVKPKRDLREQLFAETDVREMWYKSIVAGFIGSCSMVFISYLIYCFTSSSILERTFIFTAYSNGNVFNEFVGLWTATFTPISGFNSFLPKWLNDWYLYLAPTLVASLIVGGYVKNIKYSLLGVVFFVFFSILIPFIFLEVTTCVQPVGFQALLMEVSYPRIRGLLMVLWLIPAWVASITHSIFVGWCTGGALELGLFMLPFTFVFAIVFSILSRIFTKEA